MASGVHVLAFIVVTALRAAILASSSGVLAGTTACEQAISSAGIESASVAAACDAGRMKFTLAWSSCAVGGCEQMCYAGFRSEEGACDLDIAAARKLDAFLGEFVLGLFVVA